MKFAWLVARRYLRSPNRPAVLRMVTVLAVAGVAAGVATLVIALAMNAGFRRTLQDRLLGVTWHVKIARPGTEGIRNYSQFTERLRQVPGVEAAAPAIYLTVLMSAGNRADGVVLKGIDPASPARHNEALDRIIAGTADFAPDANGLQAIVVGKLLAEQMQLQAGDYVTVTSPTGRLTPFGVMPRSQRLRVTGIFDSGFYDYDARWGFTALSAVQSLAGVGDVASVVEFRVVDVDRAEEAAARIAAAAGEGYQATTWADENRALFRALRLEKLVTALFIGLITFVAGLNILVVLAMTVTDRAKDIAVLMAMGARREQIRGVFLVLGLGVGGIGTVAGLVAGYSIAWLAGTYQLIPLDPQIYSVPFVPFDPNIFDAFWIVAAALLISAASTLVPARSAARIKPVEILRYE
jgi:lipoprotein-releasing system permease protein